tara:strand:- start:599 stop:1033 length:435 start_codon:yes stop_codon:yes gene_type:complete
MKIMDRIIDPDAEIVVDEGEHDTICFIRDYLLHNSITWPNLTVDRAEDIARFYCNYLHGQTTIWALCRHVSSGGATRVLSFFVVKDNTIICIDWFLQDFLGYKPHKKIDGVVVKGCGMDMGFHTVYSLSRKLYDDGYRFKHRWL